MLKRNGFCHPSILSKNGHSYRSTRATIYYEQRDDVIEYSIAFCSPKDHFRKEKGRDLAFGRFMNGDRKRVVIPRYAVLDLIADDINNNPDRAPHWFCRM